MAELKIYNDIVNEEDKIFLREWCGVDGVCYKDIAEFVAAMPAEDKDINLHLHCSGGDVVEGWAMYDALRQSGKNISAVIEGQCSSMATIILLAAPKENRKAYKSAHICIHNPEACWIDDSNLGGRLTADKLMNVSQDLVRQSEQLLVEQNRILDLYVERTGADRESLQALMNEDKFMTADEALGLGFISAILVPNTAHKRSINSKTKTTMSKEVSVKQTMLDRLLAKCGLAKIEDLKMLDQVITAADGTEFTVEREDGDPQVGDVAYPDGSYVMADGSTVVVENSSITAINPPAAPVQAKAEDEPKPNPEIEKLKEEQEKLNQEKDAKIAELEEQKAELDKQVAELQSQIDELKGNQPTEEEAQILQVAKKIGKVALDKVETAGGAVWVDMVLAMKSTFTASNRRFVEHGNNNEPVDSPTKARMQEMREMNAKKREGLK